MKHKTEDYKVSAVKHYLNNKLSMDKVCGIFECKKTSLKRWVNRYKIEKTIKDKIYKIYHIKLQKNKLNIL